METAPCLFRGSDGIGGFLDERICLHTFRGIEFKGEIERTDLVAGNENIETAHLVAQLLVPLGLSNLTLERADLALHLAQDIRLAQKVLLGLLDLANGLLAVRLEFRNAGGLLKHGTAVFGLG